MEITKLQNKKLKQPRAINSPFFFFIFITEPSRLAQRFFIEYLTTGVHFCSLAEFYLSRFFLQKASQK